LLAKGGTSRWIAGGCGTGRKFANGFLDWGFHQYGREIEKLKNDKWGVDSLTPCKDIVLRFLQFYHVLFIGNGIRSGCPIARLI